MLRLFYDAFDVDLYTADASDNKDFIDDVDFSTYDIFNILRRLKSKFSCGPDGYCAYFLKKYCFTIVFSAIIIVQPVVCQW